MGYCRVRIRVSWKMLELFVDSDEFFFSHEFQLEASRRKVLTTCTRASGDGPSPGPQWPEVRRWARISGGPSPTWPPRQPRRYFLGRQRPGAGSPPRHQIPSQQGWQSGRGPQAGAVGPDPQPGPSKCVAYRSTCQQGQSTHGQRRSTCRQGQSKRR